MELLLRFLRNLSSPREDGQWTHWTNSVLLSLTLLPNRHGLEFCCAAVVVIPLLNINKYLSGLLQRIESNDEIE